MAKIVSILGGAGMLGRDLAATFQQKGWSVRVWDLPDWDITNTEQLESALAGVDAVVNCAAWTNVDLAEQQAHAAYAVNARAVETLGHLANEKKVFLAHISTDFVFDGKSGQPYRETDQPAPINSYGHSKLQGELALQKTGCEHVIARVQWTYGRHGQNFITRLLERARHTDELKVVNDQFGAPTWTADAANAIQTLVQRRHAGLFHFANSGHTSRYEVACFIARQLALKTKITPCSADQFPLPAQRPANSCFDISKIQNTLGRNIRSWEEALEEFLKEIKL